MLSRCNQKCPPWAKSRHLRRKKPFGCAYKGATRIVICAHDFQCALNVRFGYSLSVRLMSALGHKRTYAVQKVMFLLGARVRLPQGNSHESVETLRLKHRFSYWLSCNHLGT